MQMETKKKQNWLFILDKIDFKTKTVRRNQKGLIKGLINQQDTVFVNIYASNIGAPQHIKQILSDLKGEIDSNSAIVGDFNTPLSTMGRLLRQKINK